MPKNNINLSKLSEEELLGLRVCELPLSIEGTWIEECVKELYQELEDKGFRFQPPCYLADEWLTPDKEPVIGVPFFLAHPALIKLEKKMVFISISFSRPFLTCFTMGYFVPKKKHSIGFVPSLGICRP